MAATTLCGAPTAVTTSSGARMVATTSCGAPMAATTSCGAPTVATTSSGARPQTRMYCGHSRAFSLLANSGLDGASIMNSTILRSELDTALQPVSRAVTPVEDHDWLPVLEGRHVILRTLRPSDAASLHGLLTAPEVARFVSSPPATVDA